MPALSADAPNNILTMESSYSMEPKLTFSKSSPSFQRRNNQRSPRQLQRNTNGNGNNIRYRAKPQSMSPPSPFLSFAVEDKSCAIYVGNIPTNPKNPCKLCTEGSTQNEESFSSCDGSIDDLDTLGNDSNLTCACEIELKAFLRERINAAFKVPIQDIGIRTCRFFTFVSNVYSNSSNPVPSTTEGIESNNNDEDGNGTEDNKDATKVSPNFSNHNTGRRTHRAACVEFYDPKIAEHALALKFTFFYFENEPSRRTSLRLRRWTMEPPRSNKPGPKQHQQKEQNTTSSSPSSPISALSCGDDSLLADDFGPVSTEGLSPSISFPCTVHVGNIPSDVRCEELCLFFSERMNKAFRGVTAPKILRIGLRYRNNISNPSNSQIESISSDNRVDACVEFQSHRVAQRSTLLKNRRWYVKAQEGDRGAGESPIGDDDNDDNSRSEKPDWQQMPVLEIEMWDPAMYDVTDFHFTKYYTVDSSSPSSEVNENDDRDCKEDSGCSIPSERSEQNLSTETPTESTYDEVSKVGYNRIEKKQPPQTASQTKIATAEMREFGFLSCTNPHKTPRCAHLFTVAMECDVENEDLSGVKKAQLCHGYHFRGKVCRNHKKTRSSGGQLCPFVHIDSLDELTDPHDVLALLYWVHNNEEIEFVSGNGCTPQEYLERMKYDLRPTLPNAVSFQHNEDVQSEPTDIILKELRSDLSAVRDELASTQQKLHKSERAHQALLEKQTRSVHKRMAKTNTKQKLEETDPIQSLEDQVAKLKLELQKTNRKRKEAEYSAEEGRRQYLALQETIRSKNVDQQEIPDASSKFFQTEIMKLKDELKETRSEINKLKPSSMSILDSHFGHSWTQGDIDSDSTMDKNIVSSWPERHFDNFLENSVSKLMEMTDSTSDEQQTPHHHQHRQRYSAPDTPLTSNISSLSGIPISIHPLPFDTNPRRSTPSRTKSCITIMNTNTTKEVDLVQSEISSVQSHYGSSQVVARNNGPSAPMTVTRYVKLPMSNNEKANAIVSLILTLPKGYPSKGVVAIHADAHLSNFDEEGTSQARRRAILEFLSGLVNTCRWDAECFQGNPALMNIMQTVDRWVQNDWMPTLRTKNWMTDDYVPRTEGLPKTSFHSI